MIIGIAGTLLAWHFIDGIEKGIDKYEHKTETEKHHN